MLQKSLTTTLTIKRFVITKTYGFISFSWYSCHTSFFDVLTFIKFKKYLIVLLVGYIGKKLPLLAHLNLQQFALLFCSSTFSFEFGS